MNTFMRTALTTLAIATPVTVGANAVTALSTEPFDQIPVGFATVMTGGAGLASLGVAGVAALNAPWRGSAAAAAGLGAALVVASAAGVGTGHVLTANR
jgi:hypothetical protein